MTKLMFRSLALGTFLVVLIAAPSFTPAFAMGGGGGGGGGAGGGVGGGAGYPSSLTRLDPPEQPSSHPRRPVVKSSHRIKKTTGHSSMR